MGASMMMWSLAGVAVTEWKFRVTGIGHVSAWAYKSEPEMINLVVAWLMLGWPVIHSYDGYLRLNATTNPTVSIPLEVVRMKPRRESAAK